MELNSDNMADFSETCVCGRTFNHPGPLKYHQCGCSRHKKRWAGALEKAKEIWTSQKKRRLLDSGRTDGLSGEILHFPNVSIGVGGIETEVCASL
jgi:hypothetical protein